MTTADGAALEIRRLGGRDEAEACARMMAASEPWITLRRDAGAVGSGNFFGFVSESRGVLLRLPEIGIGALRARSPSSGVASGSRSRPG